MTRKSSQDMEQSKKFKEKARELGCDESEGRFNDALKQVAKNKKGGKPAS